MAQTVKEPQASGRDLIDLAMWSCSKCKWSGARKFTASNGVWISCPKCGGQVKRVVEEAT